MCREEVSMMPKTKRSTKPLWKRVVRAIAVFVLSFTALSMAASAIIFHVAFGDRYEGVQPLDLSYSDLDADAYPRQEHVFTSGEHMLHGYWYEVKNEQGLVVIAHGLGGSSESHLAEALYFLDHGLSVFAFDATGTAESEGDSIIGLSQSKPDVAAAVSYVRQLKEQLPIYLYGHSMGGYGAVAALERNLDVQAVVCIAGFRSPLRMMHGSAKEYVGVLADLQYPFLALQNWFVFGSGADTDAVQAAAESAVPVLFICGSEDTVVPRQAQLDESCLIAENIHYLLIEQEGRNGHTGLWLSDDAALYRQQLLEESARSQELTVDKQRISQLDEELMDRILQFYLQS